MSGQANGWHLVANSIATNIELHLERTCKQTWCTAITTNFNLCPWFNTRHFCVCILFGLFSPHRKSIFTKSNKMPLWFYLSCMHFNTVNNNLHLLDNHNSMAPYFFTHTFSFPITGFRFRCRVCSEILENSIRLQWMKCKICMGREKKKWFYF